MAKNPEENFLPMNWPPSRGPMPRFMRAKPKIVIPKIEIEVVEWNERRTKPASAIRIVPPPRPKSRKPPDLCSGKPVNLATFIEHENARRSLSFSLYHHVETIASLLPDQWSILVGASTHVDRNKREWASADRFMPTRTLTMDLSYPLAKIARVTIAPYRVSTMNPEGKYRDRGPHMDLGYVLWQIACAYKQIYRNHATWGVWGHALGDLVFEGLEIQDNIAMILLGS